MPLFVCFIIAIIPKRTWFYGGNKSDVLGVLKHNNCIECSSRCRELYKAAADACVLTESSFSKDIYISKFQKCNNNTGIRNKLQINLKSWHSSKEESVASYCMLNRRCQNRWNSSNIPGPYPATVLEEANTPPNLRLNFLTAADCVTHSWH